MASAAVAAEYAKSARSSCKKCGKPIAAGALRVGLVSKDPRGFDVTRWHHLECFPRKAAPGFSSAEEIKGFSSLKESDQEALKKLKECASDTTPLKKVNEAVDRGVVVSEEPSMKKAKLSGSGKDQKIVFSSADVKTKYKDATLAPQWKAFQTVIFREKDDGLHDSSKIAAFDFDGCLVNTSVKRTGPDAWSLLYQSIPEKLQSLYNDEYKLVIFTNEANIERWKNKRQEAVDSKIGRVDNFLKLVKVPMQVFIACGTGKSKSGTGPDDPFRKPNTGMWKIMKEHFNSGIDIDLDQSFYVGDAAGRSNDHSDADIKFAKEIGLKFYVPEDFFEA